jgi:hypothetical protein
VAQILSVMAQILSVVTQILTLYILQKKKAEKLIIALEGLCDWGVELTKQLLLRGFSAGV